MRIEFIQRMIDLLRGKIGHLDTMAECYLMYKNVKDYDTLILGSSHMLMYMAKENELNMSIPSQDLYYSYELYKILNSENKNIKNVLLSYSVFSRGLCVSKTSENKLALFYKLLYGIKYQYEDVAKEKHLHLYEYYYKYNLEKALKNKTYKEGYRGGVPDAFFTTTFINEEKAKKISHKHLKHHNRAISQMPVLEEFIKDTQKNNQKMFIVIAPMSYEYRKNLPKKEEIFSELYELCSKYPNVKIIDLYDDNEFKREDFLDENHVNLNGAKKATRIINETVKGINK